MEKCSHLLVTEPELYHGRWQSLFCGNQNSLVNQRRVLAAGINESPSGADPGEPSRFELHVEIGCGKGRFTVETAKAAEAALRTRDGFFMVALEKSADAMVIALERAAAEGLRNIKFINAFADDLTEYFAPGEVSCIYLNFCDPWPSNRHAKRRLTNRRFLELYMQVLNTGGEIRFKTDNLPLFEYSLHEFEYAGFTLTDVDRDLHGDGPAEIMTDYEIKFHSQGSPIYKCVYRK